MNLAENNHREQPPSNSSEIARISLQEEKLKVVRRKQKIGEVVVRKQVEIKKVTIPIKREKLVVERIGKNPELLTEIILEEETLNGFSYQELQNSDGIHLTKSQFLELSTAQQLLEAIAHLASAEQTRVRLEIVNNCAEAYLEQQQICDRYL